MTDRHVFGLGTGERVGVSLTDLFHRLNRVIPEDQKLVTVPAEMSAKEALRLIRSRHFTQVPVIEHNEVLGVFSYRSFAIGVLENKDDRIRLEDLPVSEYIEEVSFARVTDEFEAVIDRLNRDDAVLVGEPNRLIAIVTSMDVLKYLYGVASAYVLVAESELAVRAIIRSCADAVTLKQFAVQSLGSVYGDNLPTSLEQMTFNDYVQIVGDGRNWDTFKDAFGGTRIRARSKLERLRDLRNNVFHFRRELAIEEYEELAALRDWLLVRTRIIDAKGGQQ